MFSRSYHRTPEDLGRLIHKLSSPLMKENLQALLQGPMLHGPCIKFYDSQTMNNLVSTRSGPTVLINDSLKCNDLMIEMVPGLSFYVIKPHEYFSQLRMHSKVPQIMLKSHFRDTYTNPKRFLGVSQNRYYSKLQFFLAARWYISERLPQNILLFEPGQQIMAAC